MEVPNEITLDEDVIKEASLKSLENFKAFVNRKKQLNDRLKREFDNKVNKRRMKKKQNKIFKK